MQNNSKLSVGDKVFAVVITWNNKPVVKELIINKVLSSKHYICIDLNKDKESVYEYGKDIFKTREECAFDVSETALFIKSLLT